MDPFLLMMSNSYHLMNKGHKSSLMTTTRMIVAVLVLNESMKKGGWKREKVSVKCIVNVPHVKG